jgi:hypothetical protein
VAEDAGCCREEALRRSLSSSVFGLPARVRGVWIVSCHTYVEAVVRDDMPRVRDRESRDHTHCPCNLTLLSISHEHASSSTPGFSLRCPADRPHLMSKFVSRVTIYAPSRSTNLRVRRERQLRLTTGSDQPSLRDAPSTDPNPTSLRHVLIRTTGPSSLNTRRSVRASLSPITRRSGQRPRSTSVNFPALL